MNYLEQYGFNKEDLNTLSFTVPTSIKKNLEKQKKLVEANLSFLKNLGIANYQNVFMKFYDMFLLDNSTFKDIFDKYETEDLIEKIKKNVDIVEYL